jgi:hypothetical protein
MLYIFDSVQAAFIRGDLEKKIGEVYQEAIDENREPLIHIIGHSLGSVIAYEVVSYSLQSEVRSGVKTLCTMGTVLDMIRYVLSSGGLVLSERVRFGQDIPQQKQSETFPRWLNLFACNDPAPGFGPLLEFGKDPTNRPVCSTSKGHSTYWSDVRGVHRPFLAAIARGDPVLDRPPAPLPPSSQTSILKDVTQWAGKLLLFVGIIVAVALVGGWQFDISLLGWYPRWLLWLGGVLLLWLVFLGLPTWLRAWRRRRVYHRLVPLDRGASLNYWIDPLEKMGPDHVLALRKKGIWSLHDFLVAVVRPGGPARLADLLDVTEEQVMQWARQANLMRVPGVGFKEASSLLKAGVDSLATLSQQERATTLRDVV